jgi:L-amino acid N-acyltransferase YncA
VIARKEYRNQGLGTSVLLEAETLAQTFSIWNLWAIISEDNGASLRAFEKAGYEKAGHLKNWLNLRERFFDGIIVQKLLA